MIKNRQIHVGVAGLGRAGWILHVQSLIALPDQFRLVAVCDPDEKRRAEAIELTGCRGYEAYDEFLDDPDIDLVVIATPSHLHTQQTLEAIGKGRHVLCDKPMAVNLEDAARMVEAAKWAERTFTVFHLNHYAPDFQNILHVIDSGVLGEIAEIQIRWNVFNRRKDWQTLREFGGGLLNNAGPHALEQALSFLSKDPDQIFFNERQMVSLGDAEDHVKIVMTSENDPIVDIEVSSGDASSPRKWTVLGSRGSLWGCGVEHDWKYFEKENELPRAVEMGSPQDRKYHMEQFAWLHGHWRAPANAIDPAVQFYKKLHAALADGVPLDVDATRALRVMELIERCRSSVSNARLTIS